ncbi:MAG TPA: hypothetical protein VFM09_00610 [Marmoricola sp.]|nr:hypothetical protein [Marmoricola sp.]
MNGPRHAAVVAFHGDKPPVLAAFLTSTQRLLADLLGEAFVPRPVRWVHSTVIGLDSLEPLGAGAPVLALDGGRPGPDWRELCGFLREALSPDAAPRGPLSLQLGGFTPAETSLRSRGRSLHERSLVVDRGQVVLVGWPVGGGRPVDRLDALRREAGRLGFVHRYPLTDGATDPDAHLVVGELAGESAEDLSRARALLAGRPCRVPLTVQDLAIVVYDDPRLPEDSTERLRVADVC